MGFWWIQEFQWLACRIVENIEFLGIEYTAAYDTKIEQFNAKRAKLQFEVLEKEHKWLSDQEADVRINKD